jgi:hypothetical protein
MALRKKKKLQNSRSDNSLYSSITSNTIANLKSSENVIVEMGDHEDEEAVYQQRFSNLGRPSEERNPNLDQSR